MRAKSNMHTFGPGRISGLSYCLALDVLETELSALSTPSLAYEYTTPTHEGSSTSCPTTYRANASNRIPRLLAPRKNFFLELLRRAFFNTPPVRTIMYSS